jgi:hypothetical protein
MLLNKGGQLVPQALEDLPAAIIAFIAMMGVIVVLFNIYANHTTETGVVDTQEVGRRMVRTLSTLFVSPESASYGSKVLDARLLDNYSSNNPGLRDKVGAVEYGFHGTVVKQNGVWEFGEDPPETDFLVYKMPVTILSKRSLRNGEVIVKIWRK